MKRFGNLMLLLAMLGSWMPLEPVFCQSKAAQEQQGNYKRLILQDGSYELISQYIVKGDRVRYFSTERHNWEELPYSLVDWAATEKYAGQSALETAERTSEAIERASRERSEEEARMPLVAPGVRLPSPDGIFLLDVYRNKPELNSLTQNGADLDKNMGSNILKSVVNPISGSKQTVELKGLHAGIQSHVYEPAIYFGVDPGDPSRGYSSATAKDHLRIARCQVKKGNRIVGAFKIAVYGKVKQQVQYVETKVEPVSDFWVKITPSIPMKPGEYALVELDEKGSMNLFVWDFGVNPSAPPNTPIFLTNPEKSEPVLIQKPRKKTTP
jgi:hypothetical protein